MHSFIVHTPCFGKISRGAQVRVNPQPFSFLGTDFWKLLEHL